ncbi:hypothetical protein [Nocardiopsis sp. MG754419]|uniref:hypothetical protein n=1 Tax=Nocardiopsis sp. MG754419 TaxID=2259865 RepID=UPI001BAD5131|nr:hypothetical protein [Nocardiopsis sp. MG754419]
MDDDGVRGVRPYLFGGPERPRGRGPCTVVTEEPGEFDDLTVLVRTWLGTAT